MSSVPTFSVEFVSAANGQGEGSSVALALSRQLLAERAGRTAPTRNDWEKCCRLSGYCGEHHEQQCEQLSHLAYLHLWLAIAGLR